MTDVPLPAMGNNQLALEVHRLMDRYRLNDGNELYRAMLAYGKACAAEATERAAKVCDKRDMGDGSREDQEARRCGAAIRG